MLIADFIELCHRRKSIRIFTDNPVSDEDVRQIIEAGRWAPSGFNHQPWEFLVLREPAKRKLLAEIFEAPHVRNACLEAPVIIVLLGDMRRMALTPHPVETAFGESGIFHWSMSLCAAHMLLAVSAMGLGSFWATVKNEDRIRKAFNLPSFIRVLTALPVGHPRGNTDQKHKRSLDEMTHWEQFNAAQLRSAEQIIEYGLKQGGFGDRLLRMYGIDGIEKRIALAEGRKPSA